MDPWYQSLAKPGWTPPPVVIGTMWTILYPIIAVAYGYTAFLIFRGEAPRWLLWPIAINLVANFAFTPIQFGLRNLALASAVILVVLVTIVWSMAGVWPYARWVTIALVPYLGWVSIATVLQLSITVMNR